MKTTISNSNDRFKLPNVLVVEDNEDQWVLMAQAFQQCFREVKSIRVNSFQQTTALLEEWRHQEWEIPKLILLDLYLPTQEEGWQVLTHVKALSAPFNQIPIVVLSYSNLATDIEKSYQLGCASYAVKPTHFEDWFVFFEELRTYWWDTVTLPPTQYGK